MPSPSLNYFYGGASPGLRVQKLLDTCACSEGYVSYTDSDRRFVAAYIHEKLISGEIGDRRSLKIVQTLCRFRLYLECEYKDCTIIDYKNAIGSLFSKGSFKTKEPLSSHAIADYVTITKGFFRWMIETETGAITEAQLQKIKVPKRTKKQILKPSDLLTPDEIITFIECCTNSRDRALFSLMYEGGFRIGEIGTLRWGDLNFDKYGIQATISFKTNKIRTVRLLSCVQYMSAWKQDYPGKISTDEPVFITRQNNPVKHGQMIKQMHAIAERAGINKRIYPHLFRHSRITHMLADGIHESVIKLMMWGDINSDQLSTYAHLSTTNIDNALLSAYNIPVPKETQPKSFVPVVCPHCKHVNAPGSQFCSICGQALTNQAITDTATLQQFLLENSELLIEFLAGRQTTNSNA